MTGKFKKIFSLGFVSAAILAGFILGVYFGQSQSALYPASEVDLSLFWETYYKLQNKYVDKEKIDIKKMLYGAVSGMVKSLGDSYTVFMPPQEAKRFEEDVKGAFGGIGIEIGIRKEQLQVIAPLEGTPAQKQGLRAGDKIIKINDQATSDLGIEEAVNLIRGPKGTEVALTIFREGWDNTKEIKIIRDIIEIPSLKLEFKEDGIAYVKLYQFSEKAGLDFRKAAIEILNSPAQKIILDLRNNPGGYLEISQDIAGWFLKKDQVVAIEDFGAGNKKDYKSQGPAKFGEFKVVVLINKGSASASEILAGALRDTRGILLIGEKSFGKGSVQELEKLRDGSSLKITVAKWLTPKGNLIADIGLEPDIKVEISEKDYDENKDTQLEKALEIIKEMK